MTTKRKHKRHTIAIGYPAFWGDYEAVRMFGVPSSKVEKIIILDADKVDQSKQHRLILEEI